MIINGMNRNLSLPSSFDLRIFSNLSVNWFSISYIALDFEIIFIFFMNCTLVSYFLIIVYTFYGEIFFFDELKPLYFRVFSVIFFFAVFSICPCLKTLLFHCNFNK